jgi:peptidyl-prolyl cis-trans isomerase D
MVLEQLVNGALLDAHARRLGLSVDDETVTRRITDAPVFQDSEGNFSRARFEQALQFSNLSEAALLAQERSAAIRGQLVETFGLTAEVPNTLLSAMNQYRNETRVIAHFSVGEGAVDAPADPSESALRTYYDNNTDAFLAPETREVAVLELTPQALSDRIDVNDDEVRADYEARQDQYNVPERRKIRQIVFPDMAAARDGHEALESGENFLSVARSQGMSESDTDLGTLTRSDIGDDKIADAAFALEEGAYSEPIEGAFANVILKVEEVTPGQTRSFDEVKGEIRNELIERAASERITELRESVVDERAAGAPLSEISETLDLPYKTVTLDRSGNAPDGTQAPSPADLNSFRNAVFASDVGADEDPLNNPGGGLLWFEVLSINPASERPFDDVKAEVEQAWRAQQVREAIVAKANDLAAQAQSGKSMEVLASEIGVEVARTEPIRRDGRASGLSSAAVGRAFTLARDETATASASQAPAQTVLKVVQIDTPQSVEGENAEQIRSALRRGIENDLTEQYITGLRSHFDYTVNRELLRQTYGL